ncbi:MAG TPA: hypothetical protein ACQGQI_04120, partial [Xylella sp.]
KRLVTSTVFPSPEVQTTVVESVVSCSPKRLRFNRYWVVAGLALVLISIFHLGLNRHMLSLKYQTVSKGFPVVLPLPEDSPVVIEELPDYVASVRPQGLMPDIADQTMLGDNALGAMRQVDFLSWYVAGQPVPPDESDLASMAASGPNRNGARR